MATYRATMAGFTDRRVRVGDLVEWNGVGDPPIQGLVKVVEPVVEEVVEPVKPKGRGRRTEPDADVI